MSGYVPTRPWANGRANGFNARWDAAAVLAEFDNMGDYVEGFVGGGLSIVSPGTVSGTQNLDMSDKQECLWVVTLGGDTLLNILGMAAGDSVTLVIKQDAVGGRAITLPTALWDDGAIPTGSTAANAKDIRGFFSDGTSIYGFDSGTGMA